jgi:NADH-quinone oxidoreductase subunit M
MKRVVPLLILLGSAATAAAETTPAPRLAVSPSSIDFPDAGGTVELRLSNTGTADLAVYGFQVIEEGFGKKSRDLQLAGPVFKIDRAESEALVLKPGAPPVAVKVEYKPIGKQKQAFGALQIVTNDPNKPKNVFETDPARQDSTVTGVRLAAKGGFLRSNILPIMVFLPILGMILLLFIPRGQEQLMRWLSLGTCAAVFLASIYVAATFDSTIGVADGGWGLQFVSHNVWIKRFNIEFFMGTDGISVLMLLLTGLVGVIACLSSFSITKHVRGYFAMYLLLMTGMLGTFASLDFFLFYVFWEVMLLPMYFLIGIWGGPRKEYAAIKFFLYTLAGSVLMLLALIALYFVSGTDGVFVAGRQPLALVDGTPAPHTFDLMKMMWLHTYAAAPLLLGVKFTYIVWIGLFIGFAIKVPMFPFHTWLPDAHVEAPTAISVILAGVLLKMGIYGMFRMNFAILPDASDWARTTMAVFGVINILYGAFCAMAQTDLKKLVAYSSVSHMGYCLLGMAAFTEQGMAGAMMQMFNHGTITSMLFLLVGVIYDRAHSRGVNEFGGVAQVMPVYSAFFGFAFMASLGLPGLSGFIGEALVFLGAFNVYRFMTILAVSGVIVTAAYHLWAMQRIHLGAFREKWREALSIDMTGRELTMLIPLAVIVLVLGFYPMPALNLMSTGISDLREQLDLYQTATRTLASAVPW